MIEFDQNLEVVVLLKEALSGHTDLVPIKNGFNLSSNNSTNNNNKEIENDTFPYNSDTEKKTRQKLSHYLDKIPVRFLSFSPLLIVLTPFVLI